MAIAQTSDTDVEDRVTAARAAAIPLTAEALDVNQPSANVWFKGKRPQNRIFAKIALRPIGAAILTDDSSVSKSFTGPLLLASTELNWSTLADVDRARGSVTYCGKREGETLLCLEDADRDGRFEALRIGIGAPAGGAETLEILAAPQPLPMPLAYRPATPDETPRFDALIEQCGQDYDRPRFSFYIPGQVTDAMRRSLAESVFAADVQAHMLDEYVRGACEAPVPTASYPANVPVSPEARVVRMRDLLLEIGPKDGGARSRIPGLAERDRLYRANGRTLMHLAGTTTSKQHALAAQQKFPRPMLSLTGDAIVNVGERGVGDLVASIGFRHGYTGRLTAETKIRTLFSSRSLPAGTLLYGIPMQSSTRMTINGSSVGPFGSPEPTAANTSLVWCVPVNEKAKWSETCLAGQDGERYTLLKGHLPAFEVSGLSYDATTSSNDGMIPVAEALGDFGQPLSYRFTLKAIDPDTITLTQNTLFGTEVVHSRDRVVPRQPGHRSALQIGSANIVFADAANGKFSVTKAGVATSGEQVSIDAGIVRKDATFD